MSTYLELVVGAVEGDVVGVSVGLADGGTHAVSTRPRTALTQTGGRTQHTINPLSSTYDYTYLLPTGSEERGDWGLGAYLLQYMYVHIYTYMCTSLLSRFEICKDDQKS